MARRKQEDLDNKISIATYGVGKKLDKDSTALGDIIKQTAQEVSMKFGKRVDNKVIDTYTNMSLSSVFSSPTDKGKKGIMTASNFKDMMQENSTSALQLLSAEQGRIINYSNYTSIVENIPECAMALETYVSNILSPDDYTKSIFRVDYKSGDDNLDSKVKGHVDDIIKRYKIENLCEDIIRETLTLGDCFVSVLPYDKELSKFLASTNGNILNESQSATYYKLTENMHLSERMYTEDLSESTIRTLISDSEMDVLKEAFGEGAFNLVNDTINNKVKVRSFTDLLKDKAAADNDVIFSKNDVDIKSKDKESKSKKEKTLLINGSAVKILDAQKIVPLDIDGVCYGYYYIEPGFSGDKQVPFDANSAKMYANSTNPMNPSLTPQFSGNPNETSSNPIAKNLNITDEKLGIISNIILKLLAKKLNKSYIEENKQFKDLLYNLLKQKYLFEKGVNIIYFMPEEIVHFKYQSIFEKVVFFAKLYLATLTNTVLVKLGRGHDKRIYYVNTGLDNNHEQAIMRVVQDVKTKEFKMSNLGTISSILSLNPGAFDDFYLPVVNGEKPVEIEQLQGMDQNMENDFMEYLRKSIIDGTGCPSALLEATDNIEFAKQISTQNANFCRRIVRIQKQLTDPFNILIRTLYINEYKYTADGMNENEVDVNEINVQFPSPAALNMTNMIEQISSIDTLADYIAKSFVPDKMDQSSADKQAAFKMKIIQDKLPQIEWEKYKEMFAEFDENYKEDEMINDINNPPDQNDGYGGY